MSRSSVTRASSFLKLPDLFGLVVTLVPRRQGELLLPLIKRVRAYTEPLQNLRNWIAPFRDLTHRVALKLFAEFDLLMVIFLPQN